jgi:hypothetical protein
VGITGRDLATLKVQGAFPTLDGMRERNATLITSPG